MMGIVAGFLIGVAPMQMDGACLFPDQAPEIYGPTDVNAQTGNQGLSVALNRAGTVTVLRWPRPSFYDQVSYRTSDRAQPRMGAAVDDGIFLGLAVEAGGARRTEWLRDWPSTQEYRPGWSDTVVTRYRHDGLGLDVAVTDVVVQADDVLARQVVVSRRAGSPVVAAEVVLFENLNLVVSKHPYLPAQDWCQEDENLDTAYFDPALDAVVHTKAGIDTSVAAPTSVAVALGFDGASAQHAVGAAVFADAADGVLGGESSFSGATTGALTRRLDLSGGPAAATVLLAAGPDAAVAGSLLSSYRRLAVADLVAAKERWLARTLDDASLPNTDDAAVLALAYRALVTLVTDYDPETNTVVASITTQSPYGEDWPRDGAFFNHTLDLVDQPEWVRQHNLFYVAHQQRADRSFEPGEPFVPPGAWAMNYYADGVVGGPIPWEIDEVGYALWTFWDHYRAHGNRSALRGAYPTIQRAADFLVACRDPQNQLQCLAHEDDNPIPSQTVIGAGPVWLGLDSAVKAAEFMEAPADAAGWAARRDELGAAIDAHFFDPASGSWGNGDPVLAWPVCFRPFDDPRMRTHLEAVWARVAPTFAEPAAGVRMQGQYEAKALVALAKAWKDDPARLARVQAGLRWIAHHHATPDTHIMGEAWKVEAGRVVSVVAQPHAWEQVLFYLAALEAWPPGGMGNAGGATCEGTAGAVVQALRARGPRPAAAPSAPAALPGSGGPGGPVGELPATGGPGAAAIPALLCLVLAAALGSAGRRR